MPVPAQACISKTIPTASNSNFHKFNRNKASPKPIQGDSIKNIIKANKPCHQLQNIQL
jgi:hypothetical protein